MKYIERSKELELKRFIELNQPHKDVLIVSGARQVGKTTLIDHVLSQSKRRCLKIDLEKAPSFVEKIDLTRDFDEFFKLLKDEFSLSTENNEILFIDESQFSRRLGSYVRFMKENWTAVTVILSGSLIGEIHGEDVRRPVGREKFLDIWPFTFKEYLKALEESNYDSFPSEVYLKGFLKNYAKFLGINTERALAMYRRERDFKKNEPTISMSKKIMDK